MDTGSHTGTSRVGKNLMTGLTYSNLMGSIRGGEASNTVHCKTEAL